MRLKFPFILLFFFTVLQSRAQVSINEIMLNPPASTSDPQEQQLVDCVNPGNGSEWIEIFNESQCDTIDLSCFILAGQYSAGNGGAFAFPAGTQIAPLDFIVIGGPNVSFALFQLPNFCNTDNICSPDAWSLPDDAGWVALYDRDLAVVDAVFWTAAAGQANTLVSNQAFSYSPCIPDQCTGTTNLEPASNMTPGNEILYAGAAPSTGQVIFRSTDGSGSWQSNGTPSPDDCNGACLPASDLQVAVDTLLDARCEEPNGLVAVSGSGGAGDYRFEWSNTSVSDTLDNLSAGDYSVTLTDGDGCESSLSVTLDNVGEALEASISPEDTSVLSGDSVRLQVIANNTIVEAVWDPFIYLSCGLCTTPVSTPEETTEYFVSLEDINGCTATAEARVKLIPDENSVFIPSAFTPNGDDLNDILFVRSPRLSDLRFEIYDRWGKLVFQTDDAAIGWDGTYPGGKEANEGVFVYIVEASFNNGTSRVFKGNVTLLR